MNFRKVISLVSALSLTMALCIPAFAAGETPLSTQNITAEGAAEVPVHLTTEAATFSVTVPASLPVSVAADGTVTTATNAKIVNNSAAPVAVTKIKVAPTTGWTLVDFEKDFSSVKVNSKEMGFKIFDLKAPVDPETFDISTVAALKSINSAAEVVVPYDATLATQATAIADATPMNVVFTIGWAA